jgi:hypothetical protein
MLNCDGNRPESMAKKNLKDLASHTQGRHNTLTYQTAVKYLDHLTVLDAQRIMSEQSYNPMEWSEPFSYIKLHPKTSMSSEIQITPDTVTCTGTRFQLDYCYDNDLDVHDVVLTWKSKGNLPVQGFDNAVIEFISDRLFNATDGGRVEDNFVTGFTTLKISDDMSINAHPNFKNERPRNDWVLIRWSEFEDPVPAQVEMFLDLRQSNLKYDNKHLIHPNKLEDGTNNIPLLHVNRVLSNSIYAIVWSAVS